MIEPDLKTVESIPTDATIEVTWGREHARTYESTDTEAVKPHEGIEPLPFDRREQRGEAYESETGPPANRTEQAPQPFNQRVRRGDVERLR